MARARRVSVHKLVILINNPGEGDVANRLKSVLTLRTSFWFGAN